MRHLLAFLLLLGVWAGQAAAQEAPAPGSFEEQFAGFAVSDGPQALSTQAAGNAGAPPVSAAPRFQPVEPAISRAAPPGVAPRASSTRDPAATTATIPPSPAIGTANVVRLVLILSLMAFIPAMVISMTSFVRIAVVLSMIRHAFGMPETPPNQVLVSLALFLTAFSMMPTIDEVNSRALQPFLAGDLDVRQALDNASAPMRTFMLRQVRDQDIKAVYDMSHKPLPDRAEDVELIRLVPAFMLNELRVSFRIGFVILLPFLLIDLVVSSVLLSLGMMMVPPATLSLPLKVLMFVLIDGWSLVLQGVVGSIH
ncbi:MAG: flagellar type III secretion system pore protein FliP [Novosphingobium sp.]|nr:flagellar type III secretion system pore protein FliP [Novosphingobium sp.]